MSNKDPILVREVNNCICPFFWFNMANSEDNGNIYD